MKRLIYAAFASVMMLAATAVSAQQPHAGRGRQTPPQEKTPEQIAEAMTQRMTTQLNLSDKQQKEIYELNLQNIKEQQAYREQMAKEREARMKAIEQKREANDAKLKKILTEEQYQQMVDNRSKMAARRGPGATRPNTCMKPCRNEDNMGRGRHRNAPKPMGTPAPEPAPVE